MGRPEDWGGLVAQRLAWDVASPAIRRETESPLSRAFLLAVVLAVAVTGCRRSAESPAAATPGAESETAYLAPPRPTAAMPARDGGLRILGRAAPHAHVEITSPEGERREVVADARGAWGVRLAVAAPRLYAISAEQQGRSVHAEGALLVAPGSPPLAVMVRAGYAALPLDPTPLTAISTVDYDPGGSIAVAGVAAPHAQLSLLVDGSPAAIGQADAQGIYALTAANRRLSLGPHFLQVQGPGGAAGRRVTLRPPEALTSPYRAWPEPGGWRVEWALNGGGVQTTLLLDR